MSFVLMTYEEKPFAVEASLFVDDGGIRALPVSARGMAVADGE